jgi:GC-rich sequence DNA-binding factor
VVVSSTRINHENGISTLPLNSDQPSISPPAVTGPVYDEAYLNELKANTPSSRPRGATHDNGALLDSIPMDMTTDTLDDFGINSVTLLF